MSDSSLVSLCCSRVIISYLYLSLERTLPDNQAKNSPFKSYDNFSEENTCFINSQSLTACQKQTRQVIKISRHPFLKKGVKKT